MNKQAIQSVQSQVVESVLAEEAIKIDEQTEQVVAYIPITVTATLSVPHTYLFDVEGNTAFIRDQVEKLSVGLLGSVYSVDIK